MTSAKNSSPAERLPPHSQEAEQGVLACILIGMDDIKGTVIGSGTGPDTFYDRRHQMLMRTIVEMYRAGEQVDLVTVIARLDEKGLLGEVGGQDYVMELTGKLHSPAAVGDYLGIVRDKYVLRQTVAACNRALGAVWDGPESAQAALDGAVTTLLAIATEGAREPMGIGVVGDELTERIASGSGPGNGVGISTGFPDLDRMTAGLQPGEMFVIAARPSIGKTALALNIAENAARAGQCAVGIFSLEMTVDALVTRMLCARARVPMHAVRTDLLDAEQVKRMKEANREISDLPIYVDDSSGLDVSQIVARCRMLWQRRDIRLLLVDYLQLLHSARRPDNRQMEIADISLSLKSLAKEINIPVIVLSQLNREVEARQGGKPKLSDLRESGAIEQDADVVGMLYVPADQQAAVEGGKTAHGVDLLIAKNRNGPVGVVHLTFLRDQTRFVPGAPATKYDDGDLPEYLQ